MSALLRARVSSFLAGVAVAGVAGIFQLRGEVQESHRLLLEQVNEGGGCGWGWGVGRAWSVHAWWGCPLERRCAVCTSLLPQYLPFPHRPPV